MHASSSVTTNFHLQLSAFYIILYSCNFFSNVSWQKHMNLQLKLISLLFILFLWILLLIFTYSVCVLSFNRMAFWVGGFFALIRLHFLDHNSFSSSLSMSWQVFFHLSIHLDAVNFCIICLWNTIDSCLWNTVIITITELYKLLIM